MNWTVLKAIFRRDFVIIFRTRRGYVFICVFVMLSALARFGRPNFSATTWRIWTSAISGCQFILLVYIRHHDEHLAEERRQHTDELLLTLPSDHDVVVGKYLAGVAIYTVALLFSMFRSISC